MRNLLLLLSILIVMFLGPMFVIAEVQAESDNKQLNAEKEYNSEIIEAQRQTSMLDGPDDIWIKYPLDVNRKTFVSLGANLGEVSSDYIDHKCFYENAGDDVRVLRCNNLDVVRREPGKVVSYAYADDMVSQ